MRWVSIASRRMRSPLSRSCSQIGVFHSAGPPLSTSPPQMSLTSTSMWPWSARGSGRRAPRPASGSRWSTAIGDAGAAELRDELGGLLDRLGPVVVGSGCRSRVRATGADDRRAGLAERGGDAAARASGRAGDDGDAATERIGIRGPFHREKLCRDPTLPPGAPAGAKAMTTAPDVAPEIVARLGSMCLAAGGLQEQAWVGTRWRIRKRTFAHVLTIDAGWPPTYARAAATDGPCTVLTFRSTAPEIAAFRGLGHPFFVPGWGRDDVDSCSAPTPTGARSRSCSPRATASSAETSRRVRRAEPPR